MQLLELAQQAHHCAVTMLNQEWVCVLHVARIIIVAQVDMQAYPKT